MCDILLNNMKQKLLLTNSPHLSVVKQEDGELLPQKKGLNVIYNQDCLKGFKKIKDESVHLVLTDPPLFF